MDVLSDILRVIRLQGSVYFRSCFCSPWGMEVRQSPRASFHIVVRGECWLQMEHLNQPTLLAGGDILVLPHGAPHQISDLPDSHCLPGEQVITAYQKGEALFVGDHNNFDIVCGYFEFDQHWSHPFIDALPEVIHLRPEDRYQFGWLDNALNQIISEAGNIQPGSEVLIDRFTEVLFIQVLRAHMLTQGDEQNYLAAISDKLIGRALSLMHSSPEEEWTLEKLAREVGMSRSVFANRFHELVGQPPIAYLFAWRMQLAKRRIEQTKAPLADIAEQVGYNSDSAFKKAFKRFFAQTPASVRKGKK
ncbi:MAG: AraC family transcriptional regulator [Amphritea sp.]